MKNTSVLFPATVDIPIAAIVILRYKDKEQVFSHDQWKTGQISHNFDSRNVGSRKPVTSLVSVSINAVPWAEVFHKAAWNAPLYNTAETELHHIA